MGMTGGVSDTAVLIVCPTCGELYGSPDQVREILRNWGACLNITCMTDLSRLPLETALALERETPVERRLTERRVRA